MKIVLLTVKLILMAVIFYSLLHILFYDVTSTDDTTLYLDMILFLKMGSLLIGSSVLLCFIQMVDERIFPSK